VSPPGHGGGPDAHHHAEATSTTRTTTDQGAESAVDGTAGTAAAVDVAGDGFYRASPVKRSRRTNAELDLIDQAIVESVAGESVEVDALPASVLRAVVEEAITQHLDPDAYDLTMSVEDSERTVLANMVGGLR